MTLRIAINVRGQSVYYAGGRWAGRESAKLYDDKNEAQCLVDSLLGVPCVLVALSDAKARAA